MPEIRKEADEETYCNQLSSHIGVRVLELFWFISLYLYVMLCMHARLAPHALCSYCYRAFEYRECV